MSLNIQLNNLSLGSSLTKDIIPCFAMKHRNVDNIVSFCKMPSRDKVLKEHLQSLEFPMMEEDILEMKLVLLSRELADKLDAKSAPTTARGSTLANTEKFRYK